MSDEFDWDLTGVPKKFWPNVRDILSAIAVYRVSTQVAEPGISESLQSTAHGLLAGGASKLAAAARERQ